MPGQTSPAGRRALDANGTRVRTHRSE
jgi:hypothetical protein